MKIILKPYKFSYNDGILILSFKNIIEKLDFNHFYRILIQLNFLTTPLKNIILMLVLN